MAGTKIILFCISYAGGSASAYYNWSKILGSEILVVPLEYSGRGKRFGEGFYDNIAEASEDMLRIILPDIKKHKYCLLGHSMGCIVAYELVKLIQKKLLPEPEHLFLSGHYAPDTKKNNNIRHLLSEEDLKNEVLTIGYTPQELVDNEEFWKIYEKILRADFRIIENYKTQNNEIKLNCSVSVIGGKDDSLIPCEMLKMWENFVEGPINLKYFEGNHFYLFENPDPILEYIKKILIE